MKNKDLVWKDYQIIWPFRSEVYYDSVNNTDNIKKLTKILHADGISIKVIDANLPVKVWYNRAIKRLVIENCTIAAVYNDTETVKLKGKHNE